MIRYVVTTYPGRPGVNLAKLGHWGNMPHLDRAAAREAARRDAGGARYEISDERGRAVRPYQGDDA